MIVGSLAVTAVGTGINMIMANKEAEDAKDERTAALNAAQELENNRQPVYNPAGDIRAMKDQVTNPYANLGVATMAADIAIEEADISLANTLDTLIATGTSAGGATALANAAAKSKRDVASTIENQEVRNQELRVQGEAQVQQQLLAIEQQAIAGQERYSQRVDAREQAGIDRQYGLSDLYLSRQLGMEDAATAALMQGVGDASSALSGGLMQAGLQENFGVQPPTTNITPPNQS